MIFKKVKDIEEKVFCCFFKFMWCKWQILHACVMQVAAIVSFLLGPDKADKITIFAGDVVPRKKPDPVCYFLFCYSVNGKYIMM